ncbi:hypothetical protein NY537_14730 [Curtobacterium flaccumfaciens pv. betae]|uniref:hypothetical protein n=1 Tax=Curtobacterium flaccumfaciens TaxID=2035 RepID=UPI002659B35C|nr:hypothetical protein [Curtobacterium flaccumfaciens]MCS5513996.1 hypothetical protein [Curtobacterium flaccumfaciens pv. betae]
MAAIAVAPFMMSDATFKVAADNYETSVSSVEFAPTSGQATWKGLTPDAVFTFAQSPTWVCNVGYAQDWENEDSLSRYLFDHSGETISVAFAPVKGGATIYADVIVVPGSIGGAVDAVAASTVALGVVGKPSFTAPSA